MRYRCCALHCDDEGLYVVYSEDTSGFGIKMSTCSVYDCSASPHAEKFAHRLNLKIMRELQSLTPHRWP